MTMREMRDEVCSLPESFDPEIGQRPLKDGMANLPVILASLSLG
jgi:hypothetical protein